MAGYLPCAGSYRCIEKGISESWTCFLREDDWFGKLIDIPLYEMEESLPEKRHLADSKYLTQVTII